MNYWFVVYIFLSVFYFESFNKLELRIVEIEDFYFFMFVIGVFFYLVFFCYIVLINFLFIVKVYKCLNSV